MVENKKMSTRYTIKTSPDQIIPAIEYSIEDARKWLDDMRDGEIMTIELNLIPDFGFRR